MKNLTSNELGFVPEGEAEASFEHQIMMHRKKQAQKQHVISYAATQQSIVSKSNILQYYINSFYFISRISFKNYV